MKYVDAEDRKANYKKLILLSLSSFIVCLCDNIASIIIVWGFLSQKSQLYYVTWLFVLYALPKSLLSPFFGMTIDRHNRKQILISTHIIRSSVLILFVLMFSAENYFALYGLAVVAGLFIAMYDPCEPAFVKDIFKDAELLRANSLVATTDQFAILFGPIIGGVINLYYSMEVGFIVIACLYLLAALALYAIPYSKKITEVEKINVWKNMLATFSYLKKENLLSLINILSLLFLLMFSSAVILPIFSKVVMNVNSLEYGVLVSILGFGFGVGNLMNTLMLRYLGLKILSLMLLTLASFAFLLFLFNTNVYIAYVLNFMIGYSFCVIPLLFSYTQSSIDHEIQGRVQSFRIAWQTTMVIIYYIVLGEISKFIPIGYIYFSQILLTIIIICMVIFYQFNQSSTNEFR